MPAAVAGLETALVVVMVVVAGLLLVMRGGGDGPCDWRQALLEFGDVRLFRVVGGRSGRIPQARLLLQRLGGRNSVLGLWDRPPWDGLLLLLPVGVGAGVGRARRGRGRGRGRRGRCGCGCT